MAGVQKELEITLHKSNGRAAKYENVNNDQIIGIIFYNEYINKNSFTYSVVRYKIINGDIRDAVDMTDHYKNMIMSYNISHYAVPCENTLVGWSISNDGTLVPFMYSSFNYDIIAGISTAISFDYNSNDSKYYLKHIKVIGINASYTEPFAFDDYGLGINIFFNKHILSTVNDPNVILFKNKCDETYSVVQSNENDIFYKHKAIILRFTAGQNQYIFIYKGINNIYITIGEIIKYAMNMQKQLNLQNNNASNIYFDKFDKALIKDGELSVLGLNNNRPEYLKYAYNVNFKSTRTN